ncbi:unnamed protein product [Mesocestoides corti]|uniref:SCP domain-containing protein n=1 Tax=Mesocestoides corti TaxID=53468 RepID=A0A0R3UGV6_MESCO|nr:unnamed protein product [Mesocestoides corti]
MDKVLSLLVLISFAMAQVPNQKERDAILTFHSNKRERVKPPASDMQLMTYSQELERSAFNWVSRCKFQYPDSETYPEYQGTSMTVAMTGGSKPSIRNVIQSWFEEEKNYTYANNSCTGHCGGYKQMIWATSNEVGCAMKLCDRLESDMPKPVYLVACQYKPP